MKNILVSEFGKNVFNDTVMQERLPSNVYATVKKTMVNGTHFDQDVAGVVANAMKQWAIEKGATHYTHWFQPLTGTTAEKHDSFLSPDKEGKPLTRFSGKELVQGEPDASSFPSGGLRSTFEARGYTTWDPTSYAFIKGTCLYIPSAFVSYSGEALDEKTPLLRSMETLNKQAKRILNLFGNKTSTNVIATVGAEQEYFLVDEKLYRERPDLYNCNRTLFGARSPKSQELDDHYFGTIRPRVLAFMEDLDSELWDLGIFSKTRHNEVAPCQHEMAPVFSVCNVAADQNQLTMDVLRTVAYKHGFRCLLHEKPYGGVNGSGKHNNWALGTDDGINLLDPGKTPAENTQFLLFLVAVIKAVDEHQDILRATVASAANDHRLGAQEAPPAIISIFLGEQLEDVVKQLVETGIAATCKEGGILETGVSTLPDFRKDATDRNRTSPFAFTGNKFEFRMVGSEDSIASPNTTLNAIVAEAFCEAANVLEKADDFDMAVHDLIKEYMTKHQRIIFNGNGYSEDWVVEANRRGLPNIASMVEAVETLTTEKAVQLFERFAIFTKAELESREEILYETYAKTINIEALTMIDMASKQIIPAVVAYSKSIADTVNSVKAAGVDASVQVELLKEVTSYLKDTTVALAKLSEVTNIGKDMENCREQAYYFKDVVKEAMGALREPVDKLEMIVDKATWPIPTYADLLFEV